MNKLSRKDIAMLEVLAVTEESKGKLAEYIQQREEAAKAYKAFREAVVSGVEVEKAVEVKRKFKTGDKVRVLDTGNAIATAGLRVGGVAEVLRYNRILGDGVVMLKSSYQTGCAYFEESALELVEEKTPNELRAEVITRARACFSDWLQEIYPMYIGYTSRVDIRCVEVKLFDCNKLKSKGIAKCNPSDVFNEHIAKAIALGRALGKDVSEFENAVQPTEPVVGHKLSNIYCDDIDEITSFSGGRLCVNGTNEYWREGTLELNEIKIIDDTNAIYKEGVE